MDKTGEIVIPAIYEQVKSFSGGRARVKLGGEWLTIGTDGEPIR